MLDFKYARGVLEGDRFLEELRLARELYAERHAAHERGDALISWWLGLALYEKNTRADRAAAEAEFLRALERNPTYTSSWYYIALARYTQQDLAGAYAALSTFAQSAPEELAGWLAADPAFTGPLLEGLVGWTLGGDPAAPGNAGAAFLCELLTQVFPEEPRHWNNLGLFLRDQGDLELRRPAAQRTLDAAALAALYERALAAYERALELDPANPNYLNDTAVVLHYNLQRDLARARSLYEAARDRASEELAREDLSKDLRELYEIALRDANDNLAKLARESESPPSR